MNSNLIEQKRKNEIRTWILMALVTGVFLLLGAFLARTTGNKMVFNGFLIFALVQNVVSFWFSDKKHFLYLLRCHPADFRNLGALCRRRSL
jgi:hypothetical protein